MFKLSSESHQRSRGFFVHLGLTIVMSVIGIARSHPNLEDASLFQKFLIELFAPVQEEVSNAKHSFSNFVDNYLLIVNTRKENKNLLKKLEGLENDLFKMQSVVLENERLKQLMSFGDEIAHKKILAQVIGWDANNEFKVLRVNKGSKDGIEPRMPVITSSGLVGYTFKVSYHFTDILTVLDQNNRVDVIVERSRSFGVVEGVSQSECRMKYVDRSEPIEVGDLLITAGYGELYPKGIKVGTVKSVVKEDYALTQNVKVEPSVQFQKLEEVVVLKFEMKKEALSEQVIK